MNVFREIFEQQTFAILQSAGFNAYVETVQLSGFLLSHRKRIRRKLRIEITKIIYNKLSCSAQIKVKQTYQAL